MIIQTKFHGEQEIVAEQIISFPAGIPGFLEEKEFYLFPLEETALVVLQSIHTKEVAFIMTDPFSFFPQYEFELPQDSVDTLKVEAEKDLAVFVILTINDPFHQTTANLQAPIIINQKIKQGKQVILNNTTYITRHLFIEPLSTQQEGE
ncbi:flagellar assembly factor FliW [Cytobacillus eiseniae]|uniref:Flagellar assembly factor FliW n=1 Tax=Cytobacillus eiseniae TaxID=762947 RepID=A0ABS4RGG3_9BACI|nr:flagellar assembly protein FliW [Cytobacillus eiseniae]MBP2241981.1 flagellar assembly factor FliW [Cytobacillus eiseniae]